MPNIKIDTESFRVISIFERIAKVQPKDCLISEDTIYFLVDQNDIGSAIGRKGSTAIRLSKILAKDVRLFQYSNDPATMVKNLIPSAEDIEISAGCAKLTIPSKNKSAVIGRGGRNINIVREFLDRHFGIKTIKIK